MGGLRVLITNTALATHAGSELWVRDVATALLARGHTPIAFSPDLGAVAEELRRQTIPVVDRLDAVGVPLDLIHGHHHLETMTALLRTFRRAKLGIPHSQGFHPKPKVSFGPACPVGTEIAATGVTA